MFCAVIPISKVKFGHKEKALILEVLKSGVVAQGPKVFEFEKQFASMCDAKHAIAVNNGTTSLVACLQVLNLKPGDEVITSPFTFIATLNAILEAGATAVFADINQEDFNLDPESVEARITPRTRVIMPVNLYGQMADMSKIMKIAQKHNLRVIEDSAQSHGATQDGKKSGSYDLASFSFYATKNLTTGEGGIITTSDDEIAEQLRILRNQGMRKRYEYVMAGHNYRMTDLQAALVIPQLEKYEKNVEARRRNADYYSENLKALEGIVLPKVLEGRTHVWHQYTLRVTAESKVSREKLAEYLTASGVGHGFYYPKLVFDYDTYRSRGDVKVTDCPVAKRVVGEVISIPVHPFLSGGDRKRVVKSIRNGLAS
jgi:dTDP-4-amino-4,6-dideoxygalactose transaminase